MKTNRINSLLLSFLSAFFLFPAFTSLHALASPFSFSQCGLVERPTEEAVVGGGSCLELPLSPSPSPHYLLEMVNFDFKVDWRCGRPESFQMKQAQEDWKQKYPLWAQNIDSQYLPVISRWAKEEMKNYQYKPAKEAPSLQFHGCVSDLVLFETTLATLPSHHPLVVRYLKMYILTHPDRPFQESSVIVTIRGERFE